jgi:NIPSNAP
MQRRQFLTSSLATAAVTAAAATPLAAQSQPSPQQFYLLRRYHQQSGPQTKLTSNYISDALMPALDRMRSQIGLGPVGAFNLSFGSETPATYVLIPGTSAEALATLDLKLAEDAEFLKAADAFWNAPAIAPAFFRAESTLMSAFPGWPRLTPAPGAATKAKRIYQLRTYESPSYGDHVRKVEMFHKGEFSYFQQAEFDCIFFADVLVGAQLPCLTYMLSFDSLAHHDALWSAFSNNPDWKKLSASPRYNYESIVSNVSNLILSPLACSQV